jgi:hypothetical protein
MSRLEAMAKMSTHGGYDSTMTSDPFIVSKAIFEWWWTRQDNRGAFLRRIKAARRSVPPTLHELRAARVLQTEVGSLDMDNISFEDMVASRGGDVLSLDVVSAARADAVTHPCCTRDTRYAHVTPVMQPACLLLVRTLRLNGRARVQGMAFIRSVGDKVHTACSPLRQALVGCADKR